MHVVAMMFEAVLACVPAVRIYCIPRHAISVVHVRLTELMEEDACYEWGRQQCCGAGASSNERSRDRGLPLAPGQGGQGTPRKGRRRTAALAVAGVLPIKPHLHACVTGSSAVWHAWLFATNDQLLSLRLYERSPFATRYAEELHRVG